VQPVLAVSTAAMKLGIVIIAGLLIIGVAWEQVVKHLQRQERSYDQTHHHLMRELRGHRDDD
jgi:2-iminoacetate synthase ThiH